MDYKVGDRVRTIDNQNTWERTNQNLWKCIESSGLSSDEAGDVIHEIWVSSKYLGNFNKSQNFSTLYDILCE